MNGELNMIDTLVKLIPNVKLLQWSYVWYGHASQ